MVWWPFATKPERADTLEVIDLHSGAPLLYSTVSCLLIWLTTGSGVALAASAGGSDPGAVNFEMHCATCHAPNGSGDTVVGKSVHIPDLRAPAVQSQSDAQLAEIIANGKGAMPPFTKATCPQMKSMPW